MRAVTLGLLIFCYSAGAAAVDTVDRQALAAELAAAHGLNADAIAPVLAKAEYQQSIIDAITRPAEAKPWKAYRPIFMNDKRIVDGRAFLATHRDALKKVEADTGVPAELIVAIIGVETNYGKITGSYRVLDALYTLGAHYPPRQPFFRSELGNLFALAREEALDITALKGSYAGAMGFGQFMPSSYRRWAVDGDGDGRRDLWGSLPDVFASVANYFVAHGWKRGEPVVVPAMRDPKLAEFKPETLEARYSLAELGQKGYRPQRVMGHDVRATVLNLDGEMGKEYWLGFYNFYVISRYNRSPLYSLAVYQLSQALAEGSAANSAPAP
jgi:membrane-bound lytic murein transglycosylase B